MLIERRDGVDYIVARGAGGTLRKQAIATGFVIVSASSGRARRAKESPGDSGADKPWMDLVTHWRVNEDGVVEATATLRGTRDWVLYASHRYLRLGYDIVSERLDGDEFRLVVAWEEPIL